LLHRAADGLGMHSLVWTLSRPQDLLLRDWDDCGAVYDAASGDTHLLSALAIELLVLLRQKPCSEADLVGSLIDDMPDETAVTASEQIAMQLLWLQRLGLVQPIATPS
jgi:PqqD family protein of HPr-rel-A system